MAEKRFTVIGAGHGGRAMAAHLSLMGYPVTLYNRTFLNISAIASRGGLDLYGAEDRSEERRVGKEGRSRW